MLGAEMEVRVEEGGDGVLSNSVQLGRKSSDVSLCGNKPKRQKSQTTLKYIWNSNMNHKILDKIACLYKCYYDHEHCLEDISHSGKFHGKQTHIVMRYSLKLPSFVQYFVVLGKSIFLHFRTISNNLKKVVSIRVEMCIKSSIC
ncbi:hypothetical protein T07_8724 [Trichinella nelsoni]|uniref:Uncharacterized protein n=2 Tax=Trichinella nelsoni TaxID=6336 RepID=A0A0V0SC15_9BILA|nr:hypothetical protein T07_8724 [Trichinella nelsoni]